MADRRLTGRVALVAGATRLSYAELDAAVALRAELLRAEGARAVEARVDPRLPRVVRLSRLLGFERTQDDVGYTLDQCV